MRRTKRADRHRDLSYCYKEKNRELQAFLGKIILEYFPRIVYRNMDLLGLLFGEAPDASHSSHKEGTERADESDGARIYIVTMIIA